MMEAYTILAEHYDRLTRDVDYERWADYVEGHFRRAKRPVRSVVELGCGSGSLTCLLARRGYRMTALDLSPDMLSAAARKCEGLDVQLVCRDMSRLTVPQPADAVISCLDSVNYVVRPSALRRTFLRAHRALAPGGLFLFDVKTPLCLEEDDGQVYLDEDEDIFCVWRGEYRSGRRVCGYGIDLFVRRSDGSWDRGSEYHEEYAYTMEELDGYLKKAGFRQVRQYGDKTFTAPSEGAKRIFFAAEKE